ncbi:MAG: hypothetical protein ACM30I_01365 [Gemmatimonas sp.]
MGTLHRHIDAALAAGIAALGAVFVATLLVASKHDGGRAAINCDPAPELKAEGPTRTMYLVRLASAPSPEDTCSDLKAVRNRSGKVLSPIDAETAGER